MFAVKFNHQCWKWVPWNKQPVTEMLFKICVLKFLICIHIVHFSLFNWAGSSSVVKEETGGWAQFDWMLDGGRFKCSANRISGIFFFSQQTYLTNKFILFNKLYQESNFFKRIIQHNCFNRILKIILAIYNVYQDIANRRIPVSRKSPQGIWTWVPYDGKHTGSPLDQWDILRMKWDCRHSTGLPPSIRLRRLWSRKGDLQQAWNWDRKAVWDQVVLSHCRHAGLVTVRDKARLRRGHNDDQSCRGHQCNETSLTGESRLHTSPPRGFEPESLVTGSKQVVHWTSETW